MSESLIEKLEIAFNKRERLRSFTNAIRIVNGSGDDLEGLVLEQHNKHFAAQIFDASWFSYKDELCDFARSKGAEYFIAKDRSQSASSNPDKIKHHVWIEGASSKTVVEEYGVKFEVDLDDTMNTGLFLDMRSNRKMVAELAAGRKVLNGFSYTCSFGVHCRLNGAASVSNVDISKKILGRGQRNYELNNIESGSHEFVRFDVVEYLKVANKKNNRFDMIILDPPSFARKGKKTFSVKKDMAELIDLAAGVLESKGVLFVATNYSGMKHSYLEKMINVAFNDRKTQTMRRVGQDIDFPGSGEREDSCLTGLLVS